MQSPIQVYRTQITGQTACADPWFADALIRSRTGDEAAVREISGRCLAYVLDAVERHFPNRDEDELFNIIQDANAALLRAIESFPGNSAAEFFAHLDAELRRELDVLGVDG